MANLQIYQLDEKGSVVATDQFATDDTSVEHVTKKVTAQQIAEFAADVITLQDGYDNGDGKINESGAKPFTLKNSSAVDTPNNASILEVQSTNKGSRPFPRMTQSQFNSIASKPEALGAFLTDTTKPRPAIVSNNNTEQLAYLSDISAAADTITLQKAYNNGSATIVETGTNPIVYKDSSITDTASTKSLFEVQSTTKVSRPIPVMTQAQFAAITSKPQGASAFLSDTTKPRPAVFSDMTVEQIAYMSDLPDFPPAIALNQGQFPLGVADSDPVAGDLECLDGSLIINTSVPGKIYVSVSSGAEESLQDAYDLGNTIELQDDRPLEIYRVGSSTTYEAVTSPSTGSSSTSNYAVHGWTFVPSVNIWVTSLQYLDLHISEGQTRAVGIYVKSTSQELVQDKVAKTDPLVSYYRTKSLAQPVFLQAGIQYVIASVVYPSEIYNLNNDAVTSSDISAIESATGNVSALSIPLSCPNTYFATPNVTPTAYFQYEIIIPSGKFSFASDSDAALYKAESTSLGALPLPVMTEAQINTIPFPYEGVQAWNSDVKQPMGYSDSQWKFGGLLGRYFPTGSTNPLKSDNEYFCNSSSITTMQMPTSGSYVGSKIKIVAPGTGGFKIQLSTGQYIKINKDGNSGSTSSGGYVTNVIPPPFPTAGVQVNVVMELECIVENTTWLINYTMSNLLFA